MKEFIKETLNKHLLSELYNSNNKFVFGKSVNGELITLYSNDMMVGDIELAYSNNSMTILQLDVLPKYRGKGYAKQLMNKAISHANKKGITNIILEPEPMDSNGIDKAGLYDFYSKFGFVDTKDGNMVLNLNESEDKTIKCKNCGWTWKESESEKSDLYLCHKCGYDNTPRDINEGIVKSELVNIDDDDLYDSLDDQLNTLRSTSEISFGSADPFEVLYDDETGRLVGATWIETSGAFSPHMIINPDYRKMGLSKQLIDGVVEKYKKMRQLRGDNYTFMLNVVNNSLADTMEKYYGFKKINKDPHGNITMTL